MMVVQSSSSSIRLFSYVPVIVLTVLQIHRVQCDHTPNIIASRVGDNEIVLVSCPIAQHLSLA